MGKHNTTDYGGGITSTHGRLSIGGQPYTSLGYDAIERAYQHMSAWRDSRGLTTSNSRAETAKLKSRLDELGQQRATDEALAAQQEYFAMMQEYMAKMTETMAKEEPAAEPLKAAQEVQSEARADTARKQLLRRGLMSTMTRYGAQGGGARVQLGA